VTITLVIEPCTMPESERRARMDRAWDLIRAIADRVEQETGDGDNLGGNAPSPAGETAQIRDLDSSREVYTGCAKMPSLIDG
jgi:hypothetical protein